jgi:leucyl aminopeptidase
MPVSLKLKSRDVLTKLGRQIIENSPFGTHISLEYFTHPFPQPSIIARFEPKVRNFSQPLTILGAHQDSANYLFPLLPAPGADDDCSGTVTILEAFRILAESGYTPKAGPVEFHWYAAEEGGLLGSLAIAMYKRVQRAPIGAMIEFVSDLIQWIPCFVKTLMIYAGYDCLYCPERDRGN